MAVCLWKSLNAPNVIKLKWLDFAFWIFLNVHHFVWSSRHPTSCCSVAEIMSVLFFHTMKYRYDDPRNFNNDRFIMSKVRTPLSHKAQELLKLPWEDLRKHGSSSCLQGHAAPALYSMWVEAGFLKESELLSLCHTDSSMESHSTYVGSKHWETTDAAQAAFQLIPASLKHFCVFCFHCRSISSWTWPPAP